MSQHKSSARPGFPFGRDDGSSAIGATAGARGHRARRSRTFAVIVLGLLAPTLTGCMDTSKPAALSLEWGILDNETKATTTVANGGSATINPNHQYLVTLRVKDPAGIKVMSLWGDGTFKCETDPNKNGGTFWDAPSALAAGLPRLDTTLPTATTYDGFVQSAPFTYDALSCGTHTYSGPPGPEEYFVISGTLHIKGRDVNQAGVATDATLELTPA